MSGPLRPLARRILPILLLMFMAAIAACGSNANEETATSNANATAGTNMETSNESTGANAEDAAAEPAAEPAPEEPSPTGTEPAAAPAAEEPAPAIEDAPKAHDSGHDVEQPAKPADAKPAPAAVEPDPAPEEAPAAEEQPAAEAEGKLHVVEIVDFAFAPETLTIAKGDRIRFINKDAVGHTATADDESFDTKMLGKDEAAEIIFGEAGEFGYYCLPHPGMRGTIIVQ